MSSRPGPDGETPSRVASLAPGTRLGPYEVLGPLGAGGMGEVFGREVAVQRSLRFVNGPDWAPWWYKRAPEAP